MLMIASGFSRLKNTAKQETTTIQCGVFQYTYLKVQQDVFLDIVLCLFVCPSDIKQTNFCIRGAGRHPRVIVCFYWLQPHRLQSPAVQKLSETSFGENVDDDHDGASVVQNSHSGSSTMWKAERCCLAKKVPQPE